MTPKLFESLLLELIDENPFAIRATLQILKVEFTSDIPTLAVTCETQPRLLVNLDFLTKNTQSELQVKAVIVHEFLHVLLRHTEGRQPLSPARHLAFDAVINSIIHRQYGESYSSMMSTYYSNAKGLQKLLRPMSEEEVEWLYEHYTTAPEWARAWDSLYGGHLIADDIENLANTLSASIFTSSTDGDCGPFVVEDGGLYISDLLGNHADLGNELEGELARAVQSALKQMNGHGIWRSPGRRGVAGSMTDALFASDTSPVRLWESKTMALIKKFLTPDRKSRAQREELWNYRIPVLSAGDRRAFLRAQWSPFLPEASWEGQRFKQDGTAQVYLDVSGSMDAEMPLIIHLLNRVGRRIRRPFWAFSDEVAPAVIEHGRLRSLTTGGTSMQCVLDHVAKTRPDAAIVITDGYIEKLKPEWVARTAGSRLHILLTRNGDASLLDEVGLRYTQLEEVPS